MTAQAGYVADCDTPEGNNTEAECRVTCDTLANYTGTAAATCSVDGGQFNLSGCAPLPVCTATATAGYTLTACTGSLTASDCSVSCDTANGYSGVAVA
eukprot:5959317-Amphidinium_carterae.1